MKRRALLTTLLLVTAFLATTLLAPAPAATAAEHTVQVGDNFFSPQELTIAPGDSVTWTNTGSLSHNVHADDNSFRCAEGCRSDGNTGDPSSSAWSFTLTFDDPGEIGYHCDVHGTAGGGGMAGTVIVQQQDEPGTIRFTSSSYSQGEGSGQANVMVTREGGDDGAVSVDFSTSDGSATAGSDYTAASGTVNWADGEDGAKSFFVGLTDDGEVEGTETVNLALSNPGGGASLGSPSNATLNITDNDSGGGGDAGTLAFTEAEVSVGEADGPASVGVSRSGGTAGTVSADVDTSDGSAVAGEDYTAVSTSVTFGDGESGPMTVDVPLLDDSSLEGNETINVSLSGPTGGAGIGDPSAATVTVLDDDLPAGPCQPDATTLCVNDDRFQVQVEFRDPNNPDAGLQSAQKVALEGVDSSGLFYFFNPRNIEMLIKVLNACGDPFNRWWVFFAATTNVEFRVTVIDTQEGAIQTYTNEQGTAAEPVQDTGAFDTCP